MHPATPRRSLLSRVCHRLWFSLYGHRAGLGQPVPAAALDHEYASGAWDHFMGPDEQARHEVLVSLIHAARLHARLLDLGCGSGRLAALLAGQALEAYLGADVSEEGLRRARALSLPTPFNNFECRDFETWTPAPGAYDVITFNECLGYAADPLRTARRFARALAPGGTLIVSHFRATNHAEFWRRLAREFDFPVQQTATNAKGQVWDLRTLRLRG
jgi:2-polyprenyl-3-methyl-5-hydroxy-6-metoxy-1,4-benzoquinol methylase